MKYEPVLRKPTKEEENLFTPEFLEILFESDEEVDKMVLGQANRLREERNYES